MEGGGAYGAAKAGGAFDPVRFVQQPQVLARIGSAVSAAGAALRCCVVRPNPAFPSLSLSLFSRLRGPVRPGAAVLPFPQPSLSFPRPSPRARP